MFKKPTVFRKGMTKDQVLDALSRGTYGTPTFNELHSFFSQRGVEFSEKEFKKNYPNNEMDSLNTESIEEGPKVNKYLLEMNYRLGKISREEFANLMAEEVHGEGDAGGENLGKNEKDKKKKVEKKITAKKPEGKQHVVFEDCQDDLFTLQRKADYGFLSPKERAKLKELTKENVNKSALTKPNYYENRFGEGDDD